MGISAVNWAVLLNFPSKDRLQHPPVPPLLKGSSILGGAAGHCPAYTGEYWHEMSLRGVCDVTLAICRGEISTQALLWWQVSVENLGFINFLYSQLHR